MNLSQKDIEQMLKAPSYEELGKRQEVPWSVETFKGFIKEHPIENDPFWKEEVEKWNKEENCPICLKPIAKSPLQAFLFECCRCEEYK